MLREIVIVQKCRLCAFNHAHICRVSCGDTCQLWAWYDTGNHCFDHSEKFGKKRNEENWLSNPHPRSPNFPSMSADGCYDATNCTTFTTDGTAPAGSPCVFPFLYHRQLFYNCTNYNFGDTYWCGATDDVDAVSLWGLCGGELSKPDKTDSPSQWTHHAIMTSLLRQNDVILT